MPFPKREPFAPYYLKFKVRKAVLHSHGIGATLKLMQTLQMFQDWNDLLILTNSLMKMELYQQKPSETLWKRQKTKI